MPPKPGKGSCQRRSMAHFPCCAQISPPLSSEVIVQKFCSLDMLHQAPNRGPFTTRFTA